MMDIEEKLTLLQSFGEEIIGPIDKLLLNKNDIYAYDGFEPSGRMHIAQGIIRALNVNKFVDAGIKFKFWIADWFALMNLKLGGDIKKIRKAGEEMINIWKACGMKLDAKDENGNPMIEFIWSSEEIIKRSDEYWELVLDIATKFGLNRIKKCTQIMGRKEEIDINANITKLHDKLKNLKELVKNNNISYEDITKELENIDIDFEELTKNNIQELACSQILYPIMQCADIFFLKADITSLGMDQRKVNMLALEYCDKIKKKNKPIIISHHMIMGLDGSDKMSKSNPDNTIFMDDPLSEIKRKINKAFCDPTNLTKNPLLDWSKYIIFPIFNKFKLNKNIKYGEEERHIYTYIELEEQFFNGRIHPNSLKDAMITQLNNILEPIRNYKKN